ncbi:MAG: hypothetical protein M3133_09215 [Actinomycetota bacterium]|nr:hypothetical protein [Actinomycetota bacterium]
MNAGVGSQREKAPRLTAGHRLSTAVQRKLCLTIGFFAVLQLLVVLVGMAVLAVLAPGVTNRALAAAGALVALPSFVHVQRMLDRARRDLAGTRRAISWAAARAELRGGASVAELMAGFRLFERRWGWLTSHGRNLARERSLALLAATFDRREGGLAEPVLHGRHGDFATFSGSTRQPSPGRAVTARPG